MNKKFDVGAVEAQLLAYIATYCNEYVPHEDSAAFFVKLTIDLLQVMIEFSDQEEEDELLFLYAFENIKVEINKVIDEGIEKKKKEYKRRIDGEKDGTR